MRGVRISASRAGKIRTALLRMRTSPYDGVLEDFVAFKHPSYLLPENANNILDKISMQIFVTYFVQTSSSERS